MDAMGVCCGLEWVKTREGKEWGADHGVDWKHVYLVRFDAVNTTATVYEYRTDQDRHFLEETERGRRIAVKPPRKLKVMWWPHILNGWQRGKAAQLDRAYFAPLVEWLDQAVQGEEVKQT